MTEKSPITAEDLYALKFVETPRWNPVSRQAAFVQQRMDAAENKYFRSIWLLPQDGTPRQFTSGTHQDFDPQFSPDGKRLAFVSTRTEKPQIFIIPLDGGEARQLTRLPNGASNPRWSPDGRWIAFTSSVNEEERQKEDSGETPAPPKDDLEAQIRKLEKEHREKQATDPRILTQIPFRAGTEFLTSRYRHIYILEVDAPEAKPRRLTTGNIDFAAPQWSPDSQFLWSSSVRDPQAERGFPQDLVRIAVSDGSLTRFLRPEHTTSDPQPSPDGKFILCNSTREQNLTLQPHLLTLLDPQTGEWRDLNRDLDRHIETARWAADSSGIYAAVSDNGYTDIRYLNLQTGEFTHICGGNGQLVLDFDLHPSGALLYVAGTPVSPSDLYSWVGDADSRQVTDFNKDLLTQRLIAAPEELRYTAPDGGAVQGWLLKPPGFDPAQKYPLAVNIHGGPHVMWSPATPSMWIEWQLHAARGYVVFYCNPRGSLGYGNQHQAAIHNAWGEADMPDILAGVDAVVAQGFVDPARMAVTGGSYGGFMTSWIIGHDQRFACAVSQRGVYQLISFHGTSDAYKLTEWEFDSMPFDDPEKHWKFSPASYVRNMHTPLLILHSDQDYRVPISDAEQLFTWLKRLGRTVEFVRYPREGHELSRSGEPRHRVDRLNRMVNWFDRYCKAETTA